MTAQPLKESLLDLLEHIDEEQQAFIARLSPQELATEGTLQNWSARDLLAHLGAWKLHMAQEVSQQTEPNPVDQAGIDQINASFFQEHHLKTWDEVIELTRDGSTQLRQALQALSEEQLAAPRQRGESSNQPIWRGIIGDGFVHPVAHFAQFLSARGEPELATHLQESAAHLLLPLDNDPGWRGVVIYNLACHYALIRENAKAIATLSEALKINPDLKDWSRQDSDLVALHDDPAYQNLYIV